MRKLMAMTVAAMALAGCGRPGPAADSNLPADLADLYTQVASQATVDKWVAIGEQEYRRRNWPKVEKAFEAALELDKSSPEALVGIASLRIASGDLNQARQLVEQLDQGHPDDAVVQASVGNLYAGMGLGQLAVASYGRALDLDPKQPMALLRMAQATLVARDAARARGYVGTLAALFPGDPIIQQLRFQLADVEGDRATQERMLREAYAAKPDAQRRDALVDFLYKRRRYEECCNLILQWAERNPLPKRPPEDPEGRAEWSTLRAQGYILPRLVLAGVRREQGKVVESRQIMRDLIGKIERAASNNEPPVEPKVEARARMVYAHALMADRRKDVGVDQLLRARELVGNDSDMLIEIANSLAEFKVEPDLALEVYNDVIANDASKRQKALQYLTVFLQSLVAADDNPPQQLIDEVEKRYLSLIQQGFGSDPVVLNNLAWHLAQFSSADTIKMSTAQRCIEEAIRIDGRQANLLDTLGYVQLQAGDLRGAEANFRAALADLPNNAEVLYHLALVHEKKGDRAGAKRYAQQALALRQDFNGRTNAVRLSRL